MATQPKIGRVFNGKKIARTKPGMLPGPARVGEIIDCLNALLNMRVLLTDGQEASVTISDAGVVLQIPKSLADDSDIDVDVATRFRVKSVQGDYITCRTWDGSTEGSTDVLVAKPPQLRHSITAQTVNSVAVTYSDYAISDGVCTRKASATSYPDQDEMVIPVWQLAGTGVDAEIWADQPEGGTGVTAAPDWQDTNRDARAWCQVG